MGAVPQPLPCRLGLLPAAVQVSTSRCSNHSCSKIPLRQAQSASSNYIGPTQEPQASWPIKGSVLLHPVRRHYTYRAASADQQPMPSGEARIGSGPEEAQLQQQVAEFGRAVAQSEQKAFPAAQDSLRQQQPEQPRQQPAGADQLQGGSAANLAQDSKRMISTGAAAPAAAADVGGAPSEGAASASAPVSSGPTAPSQPPDSSAAQGAAASAGKLDMAAAVREKLARAAEHRKAKRAAEEEQAEAPDDSGGRKPSRQQAGSSDVAAGFLASVMQSNLASSPNRDLRPEAFTAMKEAERRKNVEIITVDREYDPMQQGGYADGYKPKVATWGMFPRPPDISKAYGGGRTLKPGQELESEDARAARARRVSEAMKRYKQSTGLEVDPAVQAQAQVELETGMRVFRNGQLSASLVHFAEAAALMPLRSPVGGMARLQQALTLDSLGKSQEAKAIYQSLRGHPTAEVAKKVKHLLGGFEAMTFLKADKFTSLTVKPHEYDKYFRKMQSTYDNVYYVSAGEKEDLRVPTIIATTIMVVPLLLVGVKVLQRAL